MLKQLIFVAALAPIALLIGLIAKHAADFSAMWHSAAF